MFVLTREEAQSKLLLLGRKKVVLEEKHGQAMRDLDRELEDNIKSALFMTRKGQERGGKAVRAEEEEGRRLVVQGEVTRLDRIFKKIQLCFPDLTDPQAMADQYLIQEDENFAIFNYVNEVNCEASIFFIFTNILYFIIIFTDCEFRIRVCKFKSEVNRLEKYTRCCS